MKPRDLLNYHKSCIKILSQEDKLRLYDAMTREKELIQYQIDKEYDFYHPDSLVERMAKEDFKRGHRSRTRFSFLAKLYIFLMVQIRKERELQNLAQTFYE